MNSDICKCKATRGDHADLGARLAEAMKHRGNDPVGNDLSVTLDVSACAAFELDRKATWHAERGHPPKRYCSLLTGCVTCGATGAVSYHKAPDGRLLHTGCRGPRPAEVAR